MDKLATKAFLVKEAIGRFPGTKLMAAATPISAGVGGTLAAGGKYTLDHLTGNDPDLWSSAKNIGLPTATASAIGGIPWIAGTNLLERATGPIDIHRIGRDLANKDTRYFDQLYSTGKNVLRKAIKSRFNI